jgi:hypothetical protein
MYLNDDILKKSVTYREGIAEAMEQRITTRT